MNTPNNEPALAMIEIPGKGKFPVPGEVYEYMSKSKDIIKNLSQTTADLSAMLMPMSGIGMAFTMIAATKAGEHIGEEIKPNESAFEATVKMVTTIRTPMEKALEELREALQKIGRESWILHKKHDYQECAKDIRATLQKFQLLKDEDCNQKIDLGELDEDCIYNRNLYIYRDGSQFVITTFNPNNLAPPEWDEKEYAYGHTVPQAFELLAKIKGWVK